MKIIRDLVAGVSGFSAERGDQIIVETLPFEPAGPLDMMPASEPSVQTPPGIAFWRWPSKFEWNSVTAIAAGAVAACVLAVGVLLFWLRRRARRKKAAAMVQAIAAGEAAPAIEGATDEFGKRLKDQLAEQAALKERQTIEALQSLKIPIHTKKSEVLVKHISEEAKKDPAAAAQIIRSWLNDNGDLT
jgi:flagellar biosynthesis/type III secretory pathway M-ring protein FliF/YscJ